jgi:glycosyltransferase involved in cell wall biosynthesis
MMKLNLVGAIPPPYGGVTIHVQRLLDSLLRHQIDVLLYDISRQAKQYQAVQCRRWRSVVCRLLFASKSIVHFHNFSPRNLYLYALLGLRHTTVLSLHNERFLDELAQCGALQKRLMTMALNQLDCVIVVNDKCAMLARQIVRDSVKIKVVAGFIPPQRVDTDLVPPLIEDLRKRHQYLLASNAYKLTFHDGHDLYGLDMLVELTARLVREHQLDVATMVLLPNPNDEKYYLKLIARAQELGIEMRFKIVSDPVEEAAPLWSIADIVVRATNTDGNSLSVLEALAAGTPVVASDCAPRHQAVALFTTRDLDDLERVTLAVINDLGNHRNALKHIAIEDSVDCLIHIYEELS